MLFSTVMTSLSVHLTNIGLRSIVNESLLVYVVKSGRRLGNFQLLSSNYVFII